MSSIDTIVWDFDGVLNRSADFNDSDWHHGFEGEFGHSFETFRDIVFNDTFTEVLIGEISLMDVLADWAATVGYHGDLRNVIEFWFQSEYDLDERVLAMLSASRLRNVMGTNNDPMRTQFIAQDLGFAERMTHIFASGLMGVAKPDEGFFDRIADELRVEPESLLLIDDRPDNIEAARANGWHAHRFDGQDYAGLQSTLTRIGAL